MSNHPKVFIIILNWNRLNDILECLESVYKLNYANFEVIIVDNASTDNSVEIIRKKYPGMIIIENGENLGFAGGNNVGMDYSIKQNADYVWLLNNDTVVNPDCLSYIIESAESSEKIGLVSPIIYYLESPLQYQFAGSYIDWKTLSIVYPEQDKEIPAEFQTGENVCLWGTALLIKSNLIKNFGYLKNEYFAYWEDTEYSLRSLKGGFKNRVCDQSIVWHKTSKEQLSLSRHSEYYYYYMLRNKYFFKKEYTKGVFRKINIKRILLATLVRALGSCWRSNAPKENVEACLLGFWHGHKGISGPMTCNDTMPDVYKKLFMKLAKGHPFFISSLLEFDFAKIRQMIKSRVG
jgi:GT2 family glycosyltransferase